MRLLALTPTVILTPNRNPKPNPTVTVTLTPTPTPTLTLTRTLAPHQAHEMIDASFMSIKHLKAFLAAEVAEG